MKRKIQIIGIVLFFTIVVIGDLIWLNRVVHPTSAHVVPTKKAPPEANAIPFYGITVKKDPDGTVIASPD